MLRRLSYYPCLYGFLNYAYSGEFEVPTVNGFKGQIDASWGAPGLLLPARDADVLH